VGRGTSLPPVPNVARAFTIQFVAILTDVVLNSAFHTWEGVPRFKAGNTIQRPTSFGIKSGVSVALLFITLVAGIYPALLADLVPALVAVHGENPAVVFVIHFIPPV
jgi:ABC-type antimicrobial peptide transport system permease subunit